MAGPVSCCIVARALSLDRSNGTGVRVVARLSRECTGHQPVPAVAGSARTWHKLRG